MAQRNIDIRLTGGERSIRALDTWSGVVKRIYNRKLMIGSDLPYAFGIETGFHRYGGLARRAGGVWYLRTAAQAVATAAGPELVQAWLRGPEAVDAAWIELGRLGRRVAQGVVVVRSGALRRSIEVLMSGNRRID